MRQLGRVLGAVTLTLVFARGLHADVAPGPGPARGAPSARLERRLERLQQRAAAWASAPPSASPVPSGSSAPRVLTREELAQKWAERLTTRQERRDQHWAVLLRGLGRHLGNANVTAELALHATRVADLGRAEFLAQNARSGDARSKLLARIAKLSAREAERHRRRMSKLLAADEPSAPSAAPSAAAPAASTEAPQ